MEQLTASQKELYGRIARTQDNLKKLGTDVVSGEIHAYSPRQKVGTIRRTAWAIALRALG